MTSPAGGFNLGNAHGYVDIDASGVNRNLGNAQQAFNNFIGNTGQQMQQWGTQIAGFGAQLSLLTLPMAGAFRVGIGAASDFDSVLVEIQARTGATADSMDIIRQTALQLGADTSFSAQQAGDAFLQLLTAGLTTEQALATLPNVLDAAAAGGMALGASADIVTNVMSAFNISAEDTTSIIEAMSTASGASPANMLEIGQALQDVGGVARSFGLDVSETSAIMAIFAQNGRRGSEAGTLLKSMLLNMSRPTDDVQGSWAALGTSLYDAEGNMRDLDVVFAELEVALARLPVEQQNEHIQRLAGSYGIAGFHALMASDGISAMQATMSEQASATDVAAARMNSFDGVIESLQGSVETFWITVMTPFMNEVLRPLAAQAIELVNQFTAWADANRPLVQSFLMIGAALVVLGPTLMVVGGLISGIGTALVFLSSPIALVVGGIAALAYAFQTNFMGMRDVVMRLWDAFQFGLLGLSSFGDILGETSDYVGAAIGAISSFISNFAISLGMPVQSAYQMREAFENSFLGIRDAIMGAWAQIQPVLAMIGAWFINDVVPQIGSIVTGSFIPLLQSIGTTLSDLWLITQPQLTALWDWFTVTALPGVMTFISGTVMPGIQLIIDKLNEIWLTVSPYLVLFYDWFMTTGLPAVKDFIEGTIMPIITNFIGLVSDIWREVSPYLNDFFDWFMTSGLPAVKDFIEGPFTDAINVVVGIIQGFLGTINDAITAARDFVNNNGIGNAVNTVTSAFGGGTTTQLGRTDYTTTSTGGFSAGAIAGTRDSGGSGEAGRAYMIGTGAQPELFMPGTNGSFIPNADRLMGGSGMNFEQGSVVINANSYREGREAARGFSDVIMERFRETN